LPERVLRRVPPNTLAPTTAAAQPAQPSPSASLWGDLSVVLASELRAEKKATKRLVLWAALGSALVASLFTFWVSRGMTARTGAAAVTTAEQAIAPRALPVPAGNSASPAPLLAASAPLAPMSAAMAAVKPALSVAKPRAVARPKPKAISAPPVSAVSAEPTADSAPEKPSSPAASASSASEPVSSAPAPLVPEPPSAPPAAPAASATPAASPELGL
jgi:hypothetical protein